MASQLVSMLYEALVWIFFSVFLGVIELWIGLLLFLLSGRPLHYRILQDGSVIAFAIGLAATSFGIYYLRVEHRRYRWRSLFTLILGFMIPILGLAVYLLLVNAPLPTLNSAPPRNLVLWTAGLAGSAVFYSLFINTMVSIERQ